MFTQAMPVSQSALVMHDFVHAPLTQRNGLHSWIPGGWQVPSPSHVPAVFWRLPEQVGAMQTVSRAYFEQPPRPSHLPVWPQVDMPWSWQKPRGSALSASIGQHVPSSCGRLQDTQAPWQATLQQTPSAQKPLAHCALSRQLAPFISLPQLPIMHACPLTHWLLVVQAS